MTDTEKIIIEFVHKIDLSFPSVYVSTLASISQVYVQFSSSAPSFSLAWHTRARSLDHTHAQHSLSYRLLVASPIKANVFSFQQDIAFCKYIKVADKYHSIRVGKFLTNMTMKISLTRHRSHRGDLSPYPHIHWAMAVLDLGFIHFCFRLSLIYIKTKQRERFCLRSEIYVLEKRDLCSGWERFFVLETEIYILGERDLCSWK